MIFFYTLLAVLPPCAVALHAPALQNKNNVMVDGVARQGSPGCFKFDFRMFPRQLKTSKEFPF